MKTIFIILVILLAFVFSTSSGSEPLGRPGIVSRYKWNSEPSARPDFEVENRLTVVEASIQLGPVVQDQGAEPRQWYGLRFSRLNGDSYQMWMLLDGWPQCPETGTGSQRAPVTGMPEQILLQGWLFHRVATEHEQDVGPPSQYTDLPLNPERLNGWLAFDRDADGRPWYRLGRRGDIEEGRYDYVAKTPEELKAYRAAGANFLVTHPGRRARANFPD